MCLCHYVKKVCKWFPRKSFYVSETDHVVNMSVYFFCSPANAIAASADCTELQSLIWERKKRFVWPLLCSPVHLCSTAFPASCSRQAKQYRKDRKVSKEQQKPWNKKWIPIQWCQVYWGIHVATFPWLLSSVQPNPEPHNSSPPTSPPRTQSTVVSCRHEARARKQLEDHNFVTEFIFTYKHVFFLSSIQNLTSHSVGTFENRQSLVERRGECHG